MTAPKPDMELSVSEENYLKAIYHLSEHGSKAVNTNDVSARLQTRAASVSDMLKKLASKKVIVHTPYMGVEMTPLGIEEALYIIRKHRLWEVFLVQKLHFHWDEVHEVAEQLEHIRSRALVQKLDAFLGYPTVDPHGDPIPDEEGKFTKRHRVLLSDMAIHSHGVMSAVKESSPVFLQYLGKIGLLPGTSLSLIDRVDFDGSVALQLENGRIVQVSQEVAKNVYVSL
jgi:DtxR family Mn-dependent transcriptional regulator